MPIETGETLVKFSKDKLGDSLRTVVVLYENDFEMVYLDDRLQESYSADQFRQVVNSFRIDLSETFHSTTDSLLGHKNCLIHSHEYAYVFQFPHEDCHSILLSVEPEVGSNLKSFIDRCRKQI